MIGRPKIYGKETNGALIHSFKDIKLRLKAANYPLEQSRALVATQYPAMRASLEGVLNRDSIIIPVPSGSRENKLVPIMYNMLRRDFGCEVLTGLFTRHNNFVEAKNTLALDQRLLHPIEYKCSLSESQLKALEGKNIIIVDDVIGTGESSIRIAKSLSNEGIKVNGLANLITVTNRYPGQADLLRLTAKIASYSSEPIDRVYNALNAVFTDYTRQKVNRLEPTIKSEEATQQALKTIYSCVGLEQRIDNRLQLNSVFSEIDAKVFTCIREGRFSDIKSLCLGGYDLSSSMLDLLKRVNFAAEKKVTALSMFDKDPTKVLYGGAERKPNLFGEKQVGYTQKKDFSYGKS